MAWSIHRLLAINRRPASLFGELIKPAHVIATDDAMDYATVLERLHPGFAVRGPLSGAFTAAYDADLAEPTQDPVTLVADQSDVFLLTPIERHIVHRCLTGYQWLLDRDFDYIFSKFGGNFQCKAAVGTAFLEKEGRCLLP